VAHLGVRGAAVVLDAEQACLSVRGEQRPHARAHAQCFLGVLDTDAALQARFLGLITAAGERPAARGGRAGVRR
jgi:GTP cyclohydrolase I